MNWLIFNHQFYNEKDKVLTVNNRSFCYGDGLFETLRVINGQVLNLTDHYKRLLKGCEYLKMDIEKTLSLENLKLEITDLLNKNLLKEGGRIRLHVFRNEGGYYTPDTVSCSYILTAKQFHNTYHLNEKGLSICVYEELQKPLNILANLKTANALLYVMAAIYKKEKGADECIILNSEGFVSEAISSNIFMVKNEIYHTPSLSQGCIEGVMRANIIKLLKKEGKKVIETKLTVEQLQTADEVFLTNVISGIQWVGAFDKKRYFNTHAKWLVSLMSNENRVAS